MARRHTDDDDPFDENGILKDGARVRVSLMDAMTVRDHQRRPLVTDAQGGTSGLHRPGYRIAPNITRDHNHYDQRDAEDAVAWRRDAVGEGVEGSVCTVQNAAYPDDFGSPGHIRMLNGKLVCVLDQPVKKDAMTMDQIYEAADAALREQWRTPR